MYYINKSIFLWCLHHFIQQKKLKIKYFELYTIIYYLVRLQIAIMEQTNNNKQEQEQVKQVFEFKSDTSKVLNLIINSIYSEKEIFLRELLSNSSDALEKMRFASITDTTLLGDEPELFIRVIPNIENNTLTVWDTGIGMTHDDMVTYLGTLAKSHTSEFKAGFDSSKTTNDIIGQFGVGFYSSFLVADYVSVYSRSYKDLSVVSLWSSNTFNPNSYTIESVTDDSLKRGTKVVLHLKESMSDYLKESTLQTLAKKYSSFFKFPVKLAVVKTKSDTVTDTEEKDEVEGEVVDVDDSKKSNNKTVETKYTEYETINTLTPLWKRDPKNISEEEYKTFYKTLTKDHSDYLTYVHFKVEGNHEFTCLIFVPKHAPFDMFREKKEENDVKLYVKRVFITDQCKEIVPEYLSFLKGIVDSEDLPLNISREMLQEKNTYIKSIREQITRKVIDNFSDMDEETFKTFYEQYGKNVKIGVHSDTKQRDKLAKLLRYYSMKHQDKPISFDTYISEMKDKQTKIYFISGQQKSDVESSPITLSLLKKNYDTILMLDPIDDFAIQSLSKYNDKELCDVTKDGLKLDEDNEPNNETEYKGLIDYIKSILGNAVNKVSVSQILDTHPCTVNSEGMSANMERVMRSQTFQDQQMLQYMKGKRNFAINVNHKLVQYLNNHVKNNTVDKYTSNVVHVMYETSLVESGFQLENTHLYAQHIYDSLGQTLNLNDLVEITNNTNFVNNEKDDSDNDNNSDNEDLDFNEDADNLNQNTNDLNNSNGNSNSNSNSNSNVCNNNC